MKSFRLRIILWTSVIAGAVMLGFGIAGNLAFKHVKQRQVDDLLQLMIERGTPPPSHERFWNRFGEDALVELENRVGADAVLVVYGRLRAEPDQDPAEKGALTIRSWGKLENLYPSEADLPPVKGRFEPNEERGRGPLLAPGLPGLGGGRERGGRSEQRPPETVAYDLVSSEDGSHWRMARAEYRGFNVLLGVNFEKVREDTVLMRNAFAIAFPVALLAMAACIWIFVTKAISPVRRLSDTIESVSAKSLGARLESDGEYSEFAVLIEHFNRMLERLESSFTQATRFSADAAHELKTPLAILQGQLEVALQQAEDRSDAQRLLGGLLEETQRLKSITRKLLILAKADAGTLEIQAERVDLKALVREVVELAREDDPSASLRLEADGERFESLCDETLSRQILNNLVGNALKYRIPEDAEVTIRLSRQGGFVRVEVINPCAAMDADTRSRLFDRFIRGDAARNRSVDGTGLGLSLSLEFAKAQAGKLSLVDSGAADRMQVRLELPAIDASDVAAD
ncbi:ATP-binding protein [Pelagicoccus sp. SDUM812005]|uniref:ATP-binding protein n=1 Tax=Pelagicoccus sp. SDUM812005 TaxID=3041257 RepID=UPI00280E4BAE|nr:ATP-binding protein [Pelagicoccus sp. SDUM812005]MDQ8182473.1 ATP-binding protein [Pelagicoccus sp. SDUM812005]